MNIQKDLLVIEIESLRRKEGEHDGHDKDSDGYCYDCNKLLHGEITNNKPYNQAIDDVTKLVTKYKRKVLSRETFGKVIGLIREQHEIDRQVSDSLEKLSDTFITVNSSNKIYDALYLVLEEAMHDTSQWISWWIYEMDYGEKAKKGSVTMNGKDIPVKTIDDLYNLLTENI